MRNAFALIIVILLPIVLSAQTTKAVPKEQIASRVSFCTLIEDFEKYTGKDVIVKATYRYGFEQAELYCLDCVEKAVWVEFGETFKKESGSKLAKKVSGNGFRGRTVNVEVFGTLYSGGGFGHFGAYPYKFVIKSVRAAQIVADRGLSPHALSKSERGKLCQR